MFGKKKNRLGFRPKPRTIQEINGDYNFHAAQIGHKARIIAELEDQVLEHMARLKNINKEAEALPKEAKESLAAPAPQEAPAPAAEAQPASAT